MRGPLPKPPRKRNRTRKRAKTGWKKDLLVPISPPWVRAAMGEAGVTPAELWRRVGGHEQTLAHLVKGDAMKKTRASRRAAIAKALGVAEALLAGEAEFMPTGAQLWYEYMYSARTWLAAQRLLTKADVATRRDIERRSPGAAWAGGEADSVRLQMGSVLSALMRVGVWRARLLRWLPGSRPLGQGYVEPLAEVPGDPMQSQPTVDADHEAGSLALLKSLEHILTPWFAGKAALDYAALLELASVVERSEESKREEPRAILTGSDIHHYTIQVSP